jgi:ribosomal protein S8
VRKRNVLPVSFKIKEEDLIRFMEHEGYIDNFSYYVKNLIREDMKKGDNTEYKSKESHKMNKRNANFDI